MIIITYRLKLFERMTSSSITTGKILIIDDDPGIQVILRGILERVGNTVEVASDARQAFASCHQVTPDVIMLDLSMPGIDGYQLCQMLRSRFQNIPIIIVTGSQDEETCARTISKGATDFLSKPLNVRLASNGRPDIFGEFGDEKSTRVCL